MYQIKLKPEGSTPKYKQIVQAIARDIERGTLRKNDLLPSISEVSEENYIARDTVEKAYRELKERGLVTSVQGKGYYVAGGGTNKLKVLLVFNKLSSYKKIIYYAFLNTLADKAKVDLHIHHYDAVLFKEIIENSLGKYNYYVIMPHFLYRTDVADYMGTIRSIPPQELVLLDKDLPELPSNHLAVYQDFEKDIYQALGSASDLLEKYGKLKLVFPSDGNYPFEIVKGFRQYCQMSGKPFGVIENAFEEVLQPGTAYVVVEESDLAELIKKVRQTGYLLGREIGIVSFNDTTWKELFFVSVITTDFETMGRVAAAMLLDGKRLKIKNPFYMIRRGSL